MNIQVIILDNTALYQFVLDDAVTIAPTTYEWFSFYTRKHCRYKCMCISMLCILVSLTHWGWVTHICVSNLTIIGLDNGLSPVRRQAIIWTSDWILLIGLLRTNFCKNVNRNAYIFIQENAFEYVVWKMATILPRPQCAKAPSDGSGDLPIFRGFQFSSQMSSNAECVSMTWRRITYHCRTGQESRFSNRSVCVKTDDQFTSGRPHTISSARGIVPTESATRATKSILRFSHPPHESKGYSDSGWCSHQPHGLLTRCVKLRVAHALRMPGTFSPPLISKESAS